MPIADARVIELGLAELAKLVQARERERAHHFLDHGVFWALDVLADEPAEAA